MLRCENASTQGRSPSFEASLKDSEGRRGCCSSRLAASCKESQQPVVLAPVSTSLVSVCASAGELSALVNTPLCASNIFIHRMQKKSEVTSHRLKPDRPCLRVLLHSILCDNIPHSIHVTNVIDEWSIHPAKGIGTYCCPWDQVNYFEAPMILQN